MSEEQKYFEKQVALAHTQMTRVIIEHFGDRCDDCEPECIICQKWKAFDFLFENPFEETEMSDPCIPEVWRFSNELPSL